VKYVYGPVPSRRLGVSLGVDLIPKKICTYDCIYCQIGRTTRQTMERKEYCPPRSVLQDCREALREWGDRVDYVAISGSGEPTLNQAIGEVIAGIKELTPCPVAVITNSSLIYQAEVRQALLLADVVMPSLDAATTPAFQTINRPHPSLEIAQIIQGLADFRREYKGKIWLEVLLCRGVNDGREEIEALRKAIGAIQPDKVQLNTVVRPAMEDYAVALSSDTMEQIRASLGGKAEIIAEFAGHGQTIPGEHLEEEIIHLIQRRPVTPDDLARILGLHNLEITKILDKLTKEGRITYRVFNHQLYYETTKRA
jgi:wyosine [tRNA(Phe)-imidazoG37] synthetase (radical SAM superfamily)